MAVPLILTAAGEFAAPYLIKEATKLGIKKFIQNYGSTAFQSIAAGVTGGMIAQETPPLDLQKEKLFGMPVSHIAGQGEVYSDIEEPKKEEPLKYIPGIHGPKTKEQEELEKSLREPKGTPVEPIAPFPPLVTPIPKQEKEKPEGLPIPTQEKEKPEGFPIPEQKTWRDYVLTQDKPKDITKQTEELVSDITADVSKEKADKYFEGIDELYDNEWYGSVKNIQYAIDHGLEISEDDSLLYEKYGQKNPVHEYFEDEWGGGVAEGNTDAAKVMNAAFGASLGEINTPSYYQEYLEKLHEYTLNTLGKEFKAYRLASKAEMEELITSQKENYKSFSLNKNQALAFQHLVGKHYREEGGVGETREDLVLIEAVIPYDSLVMRGRSDEKEIVVSGIGINGEEFNFYDLKGNLIQGATEGPLVKDITKQTEELVKKELSVSQQTDDLVTKTKTKHYKGELTATDTLNSDLMDALVSLTGTPEDIAKSSKLPQSHKKKIFWSLEKYILKHYPSKLNEAESHHEGEALFYITSAIYDAYTNNGKVPNNIILIEDDKGIPMGAAEIEIYPKGKMNYYPKRKTKRMVTTEPAIYIEGIGSFNRKTTDLLLEKIELLAEAEGIRYIVGEDLTSEGALKTLSLRGFKPGKKGFFEGEVINEAVWRGGKKDIKAKNMVLDLGEKYATTQEEINKEFEKERIQEQTEKLTSKITLEKVRSDVKFKLSKYANTTDVYYKGKKYAEIEKRSDKEKYKGLSDYDLKYPSGTFLENGEEVFTTEDAWLGFKDAKDALIQGIYNDLKRKKELK